MGLHRNVPPGDVHIFYAWAFANASIRASFTGAASGEIGKVAWQQDDDSFWVLVDNQPMTWVEITSTTNPPTPLTDQPAAVISTVSAVGTSTAASRADHTHAHGSQTDQSLHAVATPADSGFMGSGDKAKLDSIVLTNLPNADQKAALEGTAEEPNALNRYVTEADSRLSNARTPTPHATSHGSGGTDQVVLAQSQVTGLAASLALKADDSAAVHKTGDETLAGTKTFSSPPTVPTPVAAGDAAHKGYVDGQVSAVSGSFGPPVADAAALRALASAGLPDRQVRLVEGLGALYRYDTVGTGTDNGNGIITPTDAGATGRWFKAQAATQDHEQLTGLLGGAAADHRHLTNTQVGYLPASGEKAALTGTSGTPGSANKYVTDADARNTNSRVPLGHAASHAPGAADGLAVGVPVAVGLASAGGTAASLARSDHVHAHGSQTEGTLHAVATPTVPGFLSVEDKLKLDAIEEEANKTHFFDGVPSSLGNAGPGTATEVARADHVHNHGVQSGGNLHSTATTSAAGFMSPSDKTKLDAVDASATNTPLGTTPPGVLQPNSEGYVGQAGHAARSDHNHEINVGTPVDISDSTNYVGSEEKFSRADHVHGHGSLGGGELHALATTTSHGFMSKDDKIALGQLSAGGGGGGGGVVSQIVVAEAPYDTSTNSTAFVDLLTLNISIGEGDKLLLHATASGINSSSGGITTYRITVDGVSKRGAAYRASGSYAQCMSMLTLISGLSEGNHVVKLQWKVTQGTASIRPVGYPDQEHATLMAQEIE